MMGTIAKKLENVLAVKQNLLAKFEIDSNIPLADYPEEIEKNAKEKIENEILNAEW